MDSRKTTEAQTFREIYSGMSTPREIEMPTGITSLRKKLGKKAADFVQKL